MEITLGRRVNLGDYNSAEFKITLNSDDIPRENEKETQKHHLDRIHFQCYREFISWQFCHKLIPLDTAKEFITHFKKAYKIEESNGN